MSKKRVAPPAPTAQEVPLSDVTITFKRSRDFEGDAEDVTVTGAQLGRVLTWMSRVHHPAFACRQDGPVDLTEPRLDLDAISDLALALSETDISMIPVDPESIFRLISKITEDAKAMLGAAHDGDVERATITIGQPAETQAVAS